MDISEIRRKRLADWFSDRAIPAKEKSYISQLINGKTSFGERAARRLELSYGMGEKDLDRSYDENSKRLTSVNLNSSKNINAEILTKIITILSNTTDEGGEYILGLATNVYRQYPRENHSQKKHS